MARIALDDGRLLQVFEAHPSRALHVMEVLSALEEGPSARRVLTEALDRLVERGLVHAMPGGRYRLPRDQGGRVEGRFIQNPRGFGFVEANDGAGDVFIAPTGVLGAMHGDLVEAVARPGGRGREGAVTAVLKRRSPMVPGVLRARPKGSWLEPEDARIRGPIVIEGDAVGRDGQVVVATIERWPSHVGEVPTGRVSEVLGEPGALATEVRKVTVREGVEIPAAPDVLEEVARLPSTVTAEEVAGRVDLRALPLVTIDPDDARDHDDAVYVVARPDGGWDVTVAIADVSHYVPAGTALDRHAAERGTSVYLPDRAISMLPQEISGRIASLLPDEDRLALAVEARLSHDGTVTEARVIEAVMRSHARLTYGGVANAMGWTDEGSPAPLTDEMRAMVTTADRCSSTLRAKRQRRGALDFDLPEGRVRFAEDQLTPINIVQSKRDAGVKRAYALIEDLMLLANEVVAETCVQQGLAAIYRVHGGPQGEAFQRFMAAALALGHPLDEEVVDSPRMLSDFLRSLRGTPEARVLGMLLLRAMPQARYSEQNTGHRGLAASAYLHFTSPIRRYPDLLVHREMRRWLRDPEKRTSTEGLSVAAADCSRLERRAVDVEREVLDLYRCEVARLHLGEVHLATVVGFGSLGVYLDIDDPFLTGLLPLESVAAGSWEADDLGLRLRSSRTGMIFQVGDQLTVEIAEISLARRTISLRLAGTAKESLRRAPPEREKKGKGGGKKRGPAPRPTVAKRGRKR
ncbi:MAG: VacB/RNase II family 3'-5' exoribonuclease [Deltaproteobacteria bacterium]|nr:VacB/RNase II family 3'-5' exoribonuclease [Myxococcales bacterium]MDP3215879.1 VacB/RNase II family 3'-5' exoribonuclease [Deltaproteobacteria bacterium]